MDLIRFATFDDVLAQCEVRAACSPASRAQVFSLRYRVYCGERKWLAGHGEEERDVHDETAHQVLVTHKATGHPIATARLIPAIPRWRRARRLPFEEATGLSLDGPGAERSQGSQCPARRPGPRRPLRPFGPC